jgi:hypothetical protein
MIQKLIEIWRWMMESSDDLVQRLRGELAEEERRRGMRWGCGLLMVLVMGLGVLGWFCLTWQLLRLVEG